MQGLFRAEKEQDAVGKGGGDQLGPDPPPSMAAKLYMAKYFAAVGEAVKLADGSSNNLHFGDMGILVCGDHHQYPPVEGGERSSLYCLVRQALRCRRTG